MVSKKLEKLKKKLQRRKTKKRKRRAKKAAKKARKKRRIRQNEPETLGEKAQAAGYQARQIGGELGITTDRARSAASSAADVMEPAAGGDDSRQPTLPDFGGVEPGAAGDTGTPRVPEMVFGGRGDADAEPRVPETVLEMGGEGYDREPAVPETVFPNGDGQTDGPPFF